MNYDQWVGKSAVAFWRSAAVEDFPFMHRCDGMFSRSHKPIGDAIAFWDLGVAGNWSHVAPYAAQGYGWEATTPSGGQFNLEKYMDWAHDCAILHMPMSVWSDPVRNAILWKASSLAPRPYDYAGIGRQLVDTICSVFGLGRPMSAYGLDPNGDLKNYCSEMEGRAIAYGTHAPFIPGVPVGWETPEQLWRRWFELGAIEVFRSKGGKVVHVTPVPEGL